MKVDYRRILNDRIKDLSIAADQLAGSMNKPNLKLNRINGIVTNPNLGVFHMLEKIKKVLSEE